VKTFPDPHGLYAIEQSASIARLVRLQPLGRKNDNGENRKPEEGPMHFRFFLLGWSWWRSDEKGERGKVLNPQDMSPLIAPRGEQATPPAYDPKCSCCRLHIPHSQAVHVICSTPWQGQRTPLKAAPRRG
jgi:hypothetical protein